MREAAEERDPWSIQRIPGTDTEADLVNNTGTAKYGAVVKITVGDQVFSEKTVGFVGPKRTARIDYINFGNAEVTAFITWHLREDCTDNPPPQVIKW